MASQLKNFFNKSKVEEIAEMLSSASTKFPKTEFITQARTGLKPLELIDRARHIAAVMKNCLPSDFPKAAKILSKSLKAEREQTEGSGMAPFIYLPYTIYITDAGLDHFDISMQLQYEITKRFTAEFSIRAFLDKYPEQSLALLKKWARDKNVHVRRLVSEGTRPRLPWAPRLKKFHVHRNAVIELLELLKDDPDLYVRRSVANHLNDIGKENPELLIKICAGWKKGASEERMYVIRHSLRWLIKNGNPKALSILGFGDCPKLNVKAHTLLRRLKIGDKTTIAIEVENPTDQDHQLNVDLIIHYVKIKGTSEKVFKIKNLLLAKKSKLVLSKTISFADMTTRKHYGGAHRVNALINGKSFLIGEIKLTTQ